MNGVHCQTRFVMTAASGNRDTQSISPTPNGLSAKLIRPKTGSNIVVFQISAPATGVTRNGVISSVRMRLRPMNFRSSSNARARPRTTEMITVPTIMITVFIATSRN